jgi:hypothetical protein
VHAGRGLLPDLLQTHLRVSPHIHRTTDSITMIVLQHDSAMHDVTRLCYPAMRPDSKDVEAQIRGGSAHGPVKAANGSAECTQPAPDHNGESQWVGCVNGDRACALGILEGS